MDGKPEALELSTVGFSFPQGSKASSDNAISGDVKKKSDKSGSVLNRCCVFLFLINITIFLCTAAAVVVIAFYLNVETINDSTTETGTAVISMIVNGTLTDELKDKDSPERQKYETDFSDMIESVYKDERSAIRNQFCSSDLVELSSSGDGIDVTSLVRVTGIITGISKNTFQQELYNVLGSEGIVKKGEFFIDLPSVSIKSYTITATSDGVTLPTTTEMQTSVREGSTSSSTTLQQTTTREESTSTTHQQTMSTASPTTQLGTAEMSMTVNGTLTDELKDKNSPERQKYETDFSDMIESVYKDERSAIRNQFSSSDVVELASSGDGIDVTSLVRVTGSITDISKDTFQQELYNVLGSEGVVMKGIFFIVLTSVSVKSYTITATGDGVTLPTTTEMQTSVREGSASSSTTLQQTTTREESTSTTHQQTMSTTSPTTPSVQSVILDIQHSQTSGSLSGFSFTQTYSNQGGIGSCNKGVVVKVVFNQSSCSTVNNNAACGERTPRLKVVVKLDPEGVRNGWLVNIGDSVSNNGYGGDAGHNINDAEIEVIAHRVTSYERGGGVCTSGRRYASDTYFVNTTVNEVTFYVADGSYAVTNDKGMSIVHCSECLFALNGQADSFINYDIYLAFNRVINNWYRNGYGVCSAEMSWEC